jgi:hypothetical protein
MKNILPPDTELKNINASLKRRERHVLWFTVMALACALVLIVAYGCEEEPAYKSLTILNKKSPKLQLQADFTEN